MYNFKLISVEYKEEEEKDCYAKFGCQKEHRKLLSLVLDSETARNMHVQKNIWKNEQHARSKTPDLNSAFETEMAIFKLHFFPDE